MNQIYVDASKNNQKYKVVDQVESPINCRLFNGRKNSELKHLYANEEGAVNDAQRATAVEPSDDIVLWLIGTTDVHVDLNSFKSEHDHEEAQHVEFLAGK